MSDPPSPAEQNHWALINSLLEPIQSSRPGLRANYTWSVLHAASIAIRTGRQRISVLEFGVAGGNGLVALEGAARSEFGQRWPDAMYVAHAFDHPAYAEPEGTELVRRLDLE